MSDCGCFSYNHQTGWRPAVLLARPSWMEDHPRGVSVDACIAPVVRALWDAGHVTLGSCCGHGGQYGPPSLVLGADERDYAAIRAVIASVDDRKFDLLQWQLVSVDA